MGYTLNVAQTNLKKQNDTVSIKKQENVNKTVNNIPIVKPKNDSNVNLTKKTGGSSSVKDINKIRANFSKDFISGALTREGGINLLGLKLFEDKLVFHSAKYHAITGKELSLGQIKERYGIGDKELKKANNLTFGASQMDERGSNLNLYTPSDMGKPDINIPMDSIPKDLTKNN